MGVLSLGWLTRQKLKEEQKQGCRKIETLDVSVWQSVRLLLQSSKFMKPILDKTRYLDISNNINYKVIGFVLSEI